MDVLRGVRAGIAAAALVLAVGTVGAQGTAGQPRVITVTGEAEVLVAPDEVVLSFGVTTRDSKLATAKSQNDAVMQRVLKLLPAYGVADKRVQTGYLSVSPTTEYANGKYVATGYRVTRAVTATLSDLTKFDALLTALLEAGVNDVDDIAFRTTELRKHRDEARRLAVTAAREKAEAMAGVLKQSVGVPLSIQEGDDSWRAWNSWGGGVRGMTQNVMSEAGQEGSGGSGTLAPGQISVTARVTITFELR